MMVELVYNNEVYEDVYGWDSDDEDTEDSDDDDSGSDAESDVAKALKEEADQIDNALKQAKENEASAASRLAMLESYGQSLKKDRPNQLELCMRAYRDERQKTFEDHLSSGAQIKTLCLQRDKIMKKQAKAALAADRAERKELKAKAKQREKKRRAHEEKLEARSQLRDERIRYWPKKVYRVVLSLDTNSDLTPASSRRGSIDSLAKPLSEVSLAPCQISLSLSYITSSAFWLPRYDLNLNTPTRSGILVYRAEFCNTTSETWKDAKVILSTSQTSFQGLGEPIPSLVPWLIRLNKAFGNQADSTGGALVSAHEMEHKRKGQTDLFNKSNERRSHLFGLDGVSDASFPQPMGPPYHGTFNADTSTTFQPQHQYQQPQQQQQMMQSSVRFGSATANRHDGGLFGSNPMAHASSDHRTDNRFGGDATVEDFCRDDVETIIPDIPELTTQESTWSESGLTATYDIPGLRTISPSNTTRRQKIASIALKDIQLSYVIVPKLRAAAFLKARFRNTSSIALLRGPAGLTLDGSFLGNTNVPRCSAGESFSLSLGVDPSVNVAYSKPVVKRSQSGYIQKEGSGVYTRSCTITNTKSNRVLDGYVLDQIPVSEDERLKVEVIQPAGLRNEADAAKTGTPVATVGKVPEKWGKATAVLKKAGEIRWDFKIEAGRAVKLVLEYEARFPSSEIVVGV